MNNSTELTIPPSTGVSDSRTSVVIATVMTAQLVLTFTENLIVILVILTQVPLRDRPINSLILSLSVADFLQSVVQQLPSVIQKFQETWTMGSYVCKVFSTGRSVFSPAGLLVIALIGVERFRSLDKADGVAFSVRTTRVLIVCVWGVCLATALPVFTWFDITTYPSGYTRCGYIGEFAAIAVFYTVLTIVLFFLIPMVMTWFCYMGVIYRMLKSSRKVSEMQNNSSANIIRQQRVIRVSRTCVLIAMVFTVCWTPINIMLLYGALTNDLSIMSKMQYVWLIAAVASFVNPLIYGFMMSTFRDAFFQFFRCKPAPQRDSTVQRT